MEALPLMARGRRSMSRNTAVEALGIANEGKGAAVMVAGSVHRLQVPIKIIDAVD
jgi:hypothetical protein